MRIRSYRAIDSPLVFFGVRGRYVGVLVAFGAVFLLPVLIVRPMLGMLLRWVVTALMLLADWAIVMALQGRMSHRRFMRTVAARKTPSAIMTAPRTVRTILKEIQEDEQ